MTETLFVLAAFFSGSIPFSVWLGKLFLSRDVRQYGDGNPGAANVFRAGSTGIGLLTLILDVTKAAVPVGLASNNFNIHGIPMFLIAIAPLLGHVFSPFLRFKGGKGLATLLGIWIGLTIWKVPLAAVVAAVLGLALFTSPGWAVMVGLAGILVTLLVWLPDPVFLSVWAAQLLLLAWTHRADLAQTPRLRQWVKKLFSARRKSQ
jgi:glycerol-3-phosphate acyltransferase PlsY